jgi:hypothetical protein
VLAKLYLFNEMQMSLRFLQKKIHISSNPLNFTEAATSGK